MRRFTAASFGGMLVALAMVGSAAAAEVQVAVAANFTAPAKEIGDAFKADTGNDVVFSFGATGMLYTQITQGAPFEILLSADNKRPAQSVKDGFGVDGTVFTYAVGKVVLYSPTIDVTDGEAVLKANGFQHISVADPKTAPYGLAGMQTLDKLGLSAAVTPKIVTAENITQAQQFVDSGNAEVGFVALSQVTDKPATQVWKVPQDDYAPILQDAVLLKTGAGDDAARAFIDYLKGDKAAAIIQKYGYELGSK